MSVNGPVILDDVELMIRAAIDGVGLAFMSEDQAAPHIKSGALMRVLTDWSPPFPGYFVYYPSRRQQPRALAALIDTLRLTESVISSVIEMEESAKAGKRTKTPAKIGRR